VLLNVDLFRELLDAALSKNVNRLWNGTPDRLPIGTPVGSDHPG
jgi:hypothetical protein